MCQIIWMRPNAWPGNHKSRFQFRYQDLIIGGHMPTIDDLNPFMLQCVQYPWEQRRIDPLPLMLWENPCVHHIVLLCTLLDAITPSDEFLVMVDTNIEPKWSPHPLAQTSGRRLLLHGQGLLDVKVEHSLKDERTVLSEERDELGIIQDPQRIIAK